MNFFRNAVFQLMTTLAGIPLGLITSIVLARYLSVSDRGSFALLTTFVALIVNFSQLGWPSASIYRLRRIGTNPGMVAGTALYAVALISLATIAFCAMFRPQLTEHFFHGIPDVLFLMVLTLLPFRLLGLIFCGIARGIDRFSLQNIYRLGINVGNFLAAVLVLVILDGSLLQIVLGVIVVQGVAALWLTFVTVRNTGFDGRVDLLEGFESLRFGIKSYATSLTGQIHERIDLFMLAYFLADPKEVAFYAVAYGLIQRIQILPESIGTALYPKLAGLGKKEAGGYASFVVRHSIVWVLLAIVVFGVAGPFLIPFLYGSPYRKSIGPFTTLILAIGGVTIYRILGRYFLSMGKQEINIGIQIASIFLNVLLNLWLIPLYGVMGAAIASLISYSFEAVVITIFFQNFSSRSLSEVFVFRPGDLKIYREKINRLRKRLVK